MSVELSECLERLEAAIDAGAEEDLREQWRNFSFGGFRGRIFSPRRRKRAEKGGFEWPRISVNAAFDDMDLMIIRELTGCWEAVTAGSGAAMCVRTNYGTGILPSLFGARQFRMDDAADTLPASLPLDGGADAVRRAVSAGVPDVEGALGGRCLEMGIRMKELFSKFPNISRCVSIYHPDLQGPMDAADLLLGSELFLMLFDDPAFIHELLGVVTQTYSLMMRRWESAVGVPEKDFSTHWGMMMRGRIMLRDDSAMNLSPEMFDEFIKPYDAELLKEFGGGAVHFCGRGDHYLSSLSGVDGVYAVNMSQPEYNDMETVFSNTVDKGIALIGLNREAAGRAVASGRDLHGFVHCVDYGGDK